MDEEEILDELEADADELDEEALELEEVEDEPTRPMQFGA